MSSPSVDQLRCGARLLLLAAVSASAATAAAAPAPAEVTVTADAGLDMAAGDPSGSKTDIIVIGTPERLFEISGSGAIVSDTDLQRARVFSVNDALRQVAGVFPRDEEGAGARPNIGIRGLNPTRSTKVLLLEDGIPLSFAPYGDNASYYHPPIDRFARIEVLKGASQVRFGPQTIGGVINYITPAAPDDLLLEASGSIGNRQTYSLDARAGGPVAGGRVFLHANRKETAGNRDNQRLRFTDLFGKAEWDLGERHQLTLKGSYFQERSDITYSGLTRAEFAADPRGNPFPRGNDTFHTDRWSVSLAHGFEMADGLKLVTTAYYHHFDRDWWRQSSNSGQRPNDASDPNCRNMANLNSGCGNEGRLRSYDTYGVEARLSMDHAGFLGLGLGGATEIGLRWHDEEQRRRQVNGDSGDARVAGTSVNAGLRENNRREATALAAFLHSTLDFGGFALIPGVRAEFIDYERRNLPVDILVGGRPSGNRTSETGSSTSLNQLVPGLGATLDLGQRFVLYGGVHRGFAPPRVEDILTTGGGSVDLDAELSWNWEAGIRGRLSPGLNVDATVFVMDFENQIVPQSVAGGIGATLTSAGRTLHRGGELSLAFSSRDAELTRAGDIYGRLAATYVGTARYASTRRTTPPCFDGLTTGALVSTGSGPRPCGVSFDAEGNRLPYSPEWLVSGAIGYERSGFGMQLELIGQSAMFADDVNLIAVTPDGQRGRIGGWVVANASASYGPPEGHWEVFGVVRNIADRTYVSDRSRGVTVGLPRTFQLGVTLRY